MSHPARLILGSIAFAIFWILAVFPAVPFLPIGRTAGSLLGAMLMVHFQVITPDEAFAAIDLPILGLLFGTMVVSVFLERADMFKHLSKLLAWKSRGGKDLLCRICIISAISSALFTNDTCCVVLTEFILKVSRQNNLPPKPFLLALASSANIGSATTPIGNPQNLVIAVRSKINFKKFLFGILPAMVVGVAANIFILLIYFFKLLSIEKFDEEVASVAEIIPEDDVTLHRFSPATMSHLNCLPHPDLIDGNDAVVQCSSCKEYGRGDNLRNRASISENEMLLGATFSHIFCSDDTQVRGQLRAFSVLSTLLKLHENPRNSCLNSDKPYFLSCSQSEGKMGVEWGYCGIMPLFMALLCCSCLCSAIELLANQTASLVVDASPKSARKMPDRLFGIFFEEINHAGAGGLWAELVSNRGFEAGGSNTPSNIDPWSTIGDESNIFLSTDRSSCFIRNRIALRMEVRCDDKGTNSCPTGGVGVYNPGYWGMHIEDGKKYKVVMYVKSKDTANILVSLKSSDRLTYLAGDTIRTDASKTSDWTKVELLLESKGTNTNSRLEITTTKKGVYWLDQVSVMSADTYKGHGFRKDLGSMLENMKPQFLRFPGGSFVEGERLINAFRWRETVGPWEERPGHFNDVWKYWTDDGLGYFEFLLLAEDIGASPIWVINNGISHNDQVDSSDILPFVKDTLDSIEFARGNSHSKWGSVRTSMGHPDPFQLNLIAIGNQDCFKQNYRGNYLKFYSLIKAAYPDIKIITNCDASSQQLDHPADLYDIHVYTSASDMFSRVHQFDRLSRTGPKAFVSEYAVTGKDAGKGNLRAALAEAGFLIGLEKNSDAVELASCAPLFVNDNDRRFNPDAIVFNSWQQYGTPTYWMQHLFKESSGAIFHPSILQSTSASSLAASAITWLSSEDRRTYLRVKIVNFGNDVTNIEIVLTGLQSGINSFGSKKILLTSQNSMDENSFNEPTKVVPVSSMFPSAGTKMDVILFPHSLTALDLLLDSTSYRSAI